MFTGIKANARWMVPRLTASLTVNSLLLHQLRALPTARLAFPHREDGVFSLCLIPFGLIPFRLANVKVPFGLKHALINLHLILLAACLLSFT